MKKIRDTQGFANLRICPLGRVLRAFSRQEMGVIYSSLYEKYLIGKDFEQYEGKAFILNTDWRGGKDFEMNVYPYLQKEADFIVGFFPNERLCNLSKEFREVLRRAGDVSGQDRGPYLLMIHKGKIFSYGRTFSVHFHPQMDGKRLASNILEFKQKVLGK